MSWVIDRVETYASSGLAVETALSDDGGLVGSREPPIRRETMVRAHRRMGRENAPMTMKRLGGLAIVIGRRCACLVAPDGVHAPAYPYCRVRIGFGQKGER
ncbi:hypothetical protein P5V15_011898 [Pogonomyrmex californicus]